MCYLMSNTVERQGERRSKGREKNKAREGEQGKNSVRGKRKLLYLVIQVTGVE